jgi:rhodanese-related sulfurtransferase
MKKFTKVFVLSLAVIFILSGLSFAGFAYKVKKPHIGGDVTPSQAFEMIQDDPEHTFIVDVRTRPEYQLIGHPQGAYNIPIKFWTGKFTRKSYGESVNPDFGKDLLARFNPKTDTLIFMCRSASRSCAACNEADLAGFAEDKIFSLMGGFEGGKVKFGPSANCGQRKVGGWRNEGLPWTYSMDKKLVYQPDLAK